jgi:hypothetical protein
VSGGTSESAGSTRGTTVSFSSCTTKPGKTGELNKAMKAANNSNSAMSNATTVTSV